MVSSAFSPDQTSFLAPKTNSKSRLSIRYVMPSAHLTLREEDVVRLLLEFLQNRSLHIAQLSIERETGVINGNYSDDVLFLRQLILDGQWDDCLEFIQPLESLEAFDMKKFRYIVLQHKYVELLCIKSEAIGAMGMSTNVDSAVEEVVQVLNDLEKVSPSKEEYSNLCLMLTLPRLSDHLHYKDWNPSRARVQCFRDVFPLVEPFLPSIKMGGESSLCSKNDRLVQLIVKGMLYESCVRYCQSKATGSKVPFLQEVNLSRVLDGSVGFNDSDLSLLSWLQSIPNDTFAVPFEQKTLNIDVEQIEKPSLETSWTEHMLVTPIKPKTFPHSAMPFTRPKSAADVMSRSLLPALDGLPNGLPAEKGKTTAMTFSTGDLSKSSLASFHLGGSNKPPVKNGMNTSVDKLFENESEVFLSGTYDQLPSISEIHQRSVPKEAAVAAAEEEEEEEVDRAVNGKGNATAPSNLIFDRTSRKDFPNAKDVTNDGRYSADQIYDQVDLFREFQRQKNKERDRDISRQDGLSRNNSACSSVKNFQQTSFVTSSPIIHQRIPASSSPPLPQPSNNNIIKTPINLPPPQNLATYDNLNNGNGSPYCNLPNPVVNGMNGTKGKDVESHYESVKGRNGRQEGDGSSQSSATNRPKFLPVTTLEDVQAVRCAEFHPRGSLYAVGSNSKTLRICAYPKLSDLREDHKPCQPTVLFKRTKHHKGSIYCMAWTPIGDLIATGSNDKTVKLMKFNSDTANFEGQEIELTMHDGTVRDLCFLEDTSNKSSLLISGGAGDCKIYVTDCATGQPYQALSGHSGHILSLYNWGGAIFASGSQDRTVRFWDLRTRGCVNIITPITSLTTKQGSPVASVCVDPSGRLLVTGHEDASCVLYDIRGSRSLQCFKPHAADVRSIRFSPSAYYLLTGGYDNKLVLTDLQGDLTAPLPSVVVAQHQDKVISGRWHPAEFTFLSASADKSSTLWALPPV